MFPLFVSGGAILSRLVMVVPGIFLYNDLRVVITEMVDSCCCFSFFFFIVLMCCIVVLSSQSALLFKNVSQASVVFGFVY